MLGLLLTTLTASAGNLEWTWDPSTPVKYHAEATLELPQSQVFHGRENAEARVGKVAVVIDTTCAGQPIAKYFRVDCVIDKAELSATALAADQTVVDAVMAEYVQLLTGQTVQVELRRDGHIRQVDLEGVSKQDERHAMVHEELRQLVKRVYAPLGMQLPKKGDAGAQSWKHKGMHVGFELLSKHGTTGGTSLDYKVSAVDAGSVTVDATGRGNLATGLELESSGAMSVGMLFFGQFRFADGGIAYSEVRVDGRSTASSANVGSDRRYGLTAWMARVRPDGSQEPAG